MYFLTFYYFFIYQNPKSLCFSHSLQNSFIHAYLLKLGLNMSEFWVKFATITLFTVFLRRVALILAFSPNL